jgi:hypothetical protein
MNMEQTDPPAKVASNDQLGRIVLGRAVPDFALLQRLREERDLCAAEHADDIANLLHEAVQHITILEQDARRWRWLADATNWTCALNQFSGPKFREYMWATQFSAPLHEENGGLAGAIDAAIARAA